MGFFSLTSFSSWEGTLGQRKGCGNEDTTELQFAFSVEAGNRSSFRNEMLERVTRPESGNPRFFTNLLITPQLVNDPRGP